METSVNNKCRAFTSLEQSRKLAEILPLESADMFCADVFDKDKEAHSYNFHILSTWGCNTFAEIKERESKHVKFIPAWSLGALINFLPSSLKDEIGMEFSLSMQKDYIEYVNPNISGLYSTYIHTCGNTNLTDSCYEMILKLHEQNLL